MTRPKKVRWPKAHVRALAWVAGATTFFTGVAVLGAGPKPAAGETTPKPPRRVIIRRIIKRVVIVSPATPAYTPPAYTPPVSISTGGGTSYVAPPPPVTTGGSHPV